MVGVTSHVGKNLVLANVPIIDKAINSVVACILHHNGRVNTASVLAKRFEGTSPTTQPQPSVKCGFFVPSLESFFRPKFLVLLTETEGGTEFDVSARPP